LGSDCRFVGPFPNELGLGNRLLDVVVLLGGGASKHVASIVPGVAVLGLPLGIHLKLVVELLDVLHLIFLVFYLADHMAVFLHFLYQILGVRDVVAIVLRVLPRISLILNGHLFLPGRLLGDYELLLASHAPATRVHDHHVLAVLFGLLGVLLILVFN